MPDPILSFEKRVACRRCNASGKIQSIKANTLWDDCPTCLGEGKVLTYVPVSEEQLDEDIALGAELTQLRQAKEAARLAAARMLRTFAAIRSMLADLGDEPIAKTGIKLASEGEAQAAALITLLRDGGVQ
jgi:hypothetical protein